MNSGVFAASSFRELLDGLNARSQTAFTQLVVQLDADLLRIAYIVANDGESARDAVQATWEKVWASPPVLRKPSSLKSWLLKVAANEAKQASRRNRRAQARDRRSGNLHNHGDPAGRIEIIDLAIALDALSSEDREILALRFVLDMSSVEIGAHLGLTPEGARSRVHRAVHRLREVLANG